jgi:hypothetical protein
LGNLIRQDSNDYQAGFDDIVVGYVDMPNLKEARRVCTFKLPVYKQLNAHLTDEREHPILHF